MFSRQPLRITAPPSREPPKTRYLDVTVIGASDLHAHSPFSIGLYVRVGIEGAMKFSTAAIRSQRLYWNKTFSFISSNAEPHLVFEIYRKRWSGADRLIGQVLHTVATSQNGNVATFKKDIVTPTMGGSVAGQLEFTVESHMHGDLALSTRAAMEGLKTPSSMQQVGGGVDSVHDAVVAVNSALDQPQVIETIVSPLIARLKIFADIMTEVPEIHAYATASWQMLSLSCQRYDRQKLMDESLRDLFSVINALYERINKFQKRKGSTNSEVPDVSEHILLRVVTQTVNCVYLIREYCLPSYTRRLTKNVVQSMDGKIAEYKKVFESMEKEFERKILEGTYPIPSFIRGRFDNPGVKFDLTGLPLVEGASLAMSPDAQCLSGTCLDTLSVMTDWINCVTAHSKSQRIFLLTGPAGSGKSTIAHTIASRFDTIGRLGASFAFSRADQSRKITHLFPHIARQVARLDGAVQKALSEVLSRNEELQVITDLRKQFDYFLVRVLKALTITGPIVIVIDAIDEAYDYTYEGMNGRENLIAVLVDMAEELPSNIRIIITSRPDREILRRFEHPNMVHRQDMMSQISPNSIANDMVLHTRIHLSPVGIDEQDCRQIALMSEGLFLFASVACRDILAHSSPTMQCRRIIDSGVKGLDELYERLLDDHFDADGLTDFKSVMSYILALQEPVSRVTLRSLWMASGGDLDVLNTVLGGMRSLLDGVDDPTKLVGLCHMSLRDFLLDTHRSKAFSIPDTALRKAHEDLVLACLRIMGEQLCFNMCRIESSYLLNKELADLSARIKEYIHAECLYACRSWAEHLKSSVEGLKEFLVSKTIQEVLDVFLSDKLLYWLEVLSVLGRMSIALPAMSVLTTHLMKGNFGWAIENNVLLSLAKDARDFVQHCTPVASLAATHIYLSALSFIPPTSAIFDLYGPRFPHTLKVVDAALVLQETSAVRPTIYCPNTSHIAVSADGVLIAADSGKTVLTFNFHTGEHVGNIFQGHVSWINDLQFSVDGASLASCSDDATIRLWDVRANTGKTVGEPLRGHEGSVKTVVWSGDGQRLVSGSDDCTVRAWDAPSGKELWCTYVGYRVHSVAYSPDGALVAAAGWSSDISLLSSDGRSTGILSGHTSSINSVVFSPDGTRLASGSNDNTIRVWDEQARKLVGEPLEGHAERISGVVFSPDGNLIASVSTTELTLWNLGATGPISGRILGSTDSSSLAFTPDGVSIVTASGNSVTVWDADRRTTKDTYAHHTEAVTCLAFSPVSLQIVSGSDDKTVRIWDSTTGKAIGLPLGHPGPVVAVAVSPDGALIVSGSEQALYLWDVATSKRVGDPLEGHESTVRAVCFSEDRRRILSCSESELLIWDSDTRTLLSEGESKFPSFRLDSFAFGPDRKVLVGGSYASDEVLLWNVALQEPHGSSWSINSPSSVAISPDGSHISLGCRNGEVSVWDLSGKRLGLYRGHRDWVRAVTFNPKGAHVASGSDDRTVRITDVESGEAIGHPIQCGDEVFTLAFTTDGMRLASGLRNGHIQIWGVSPESLVSGYTGNLLFSYDVNHAMPSLEMLFRQNYLPGDDIQDRIRLDSTGFVMANVDNEDRLLFWVPTHLRKDLHLPRRYMLAQLGSVDLDLSQFVHGTDWTRCFVSQS